MFRRISSSSIMKYVAPAALLFCQATAFTVVPQLAVPSAFTGTTSLRAGDYAPLEGEGKINLKVKPALSGWRLNVLYLGAHSSYSCNAFLNLLVHPRSIWIRPKSPPRSILKKERKCTAAVGFREPFHCATERTRNTTRLQVTMWDL